MNKNHYYPFGLKHQKYTNAQPRDILANEDETSKAIIPTDPALDAAPYRNYDYKYNGKEWQDELGLNMYDMDMRMYDPALARWVVMDPVIHHSMSPYNAFDNNPVFWADPSGADGEQQSTGSPDATLVGGIKLSSFASTTSSGFAYVSSDSYESTKKNDFNSDKKTSAAVEIADVERNIDPKEWETENWVYFNVDDIEEANNKLEGYLDGTKLDNLLIITHGGHNVTDGEERAGIIVSVNGDRMELSNLNSDNPLVKSFLSLLGNVKQGGNVIIGACEPGLSNKFSQTLHALSNNAYNLYLNKDWSSFRMHGSDRSIFGPITKSNNYKYGWSYLKSGDSTNVVHKVKNVVILMDGSIKTK